jgi:hypothetical protein
MDSTITAVLYTGSDTGMKELVATGNTGIDSEHGTAVFKCAMLPPSCNVPVLSHDLRLTAGVTRPAIFNSSAANMFQSSCTLNQRSH